MCHSHSYCLDIIPGIAVEPDKLKTLSTVHAVVHESRYNYTNSSQTLETNVMLIIKKTVMISNSIRNIIVIEKKMDTHFSCIEINSYDLKLNTQGHSLMTRQSSTNGKN